MTTGRVWRSSRGVTSVPHCQPPSRCHSRTTLIFHPKDDPRGGKGLRLDRRRFRSPHSDGFPGDVPSSLLRVTCHHDHLSQEIPLRPADTAAATTRGPPFVSSAQGRFRETSASGDAPPFGTTLRGNRRARTPRPHPTAIAELEGRRKALLRTPYGVNRRCRFLPVLVSGPDGRAESCRICSSSGSNAPK